MWKIKKFIDKVKVKNEEKVFYKALINTEIFKAFIERILS